jgi:HK97 family phage major capsid protein
MSELIELLEKQGKAFESFKNANDARLAAIEAKGYADPLLEEKVNKANADITAILAQVSELEKKAGRIPQGSNVSREVEDHAKAYGEFLRKGTTDNLAELQSKALAIGTDADGGYAVPEQLDRDILALMKEVSPMRQACNVVTIGGATYRKLVDIGGTTSGWVGETAARPATNTPQLAEITPFMGEIYANPAATQQMLDDVFFNAEGWLSESVAEEFAKQEALAFLTGNGTSKPKGLLAYTSAATADGTRAFGTLEHMATAGAAAITTDELITLVYKLKRDHRGGAKWMMNKGTVAYLRKLKDTDNNYLWQPGLQAGQPASLLGYGIEENDDMASIATTAIAVMFGNFKKAYTIVDRIGIRTLRDPYTNKPYVNFYSTKRVGGMLVDSESVKLLKQA